MNFELRYKRNDAKFGRIEINSLRELHRAFWNDIIDIDFENRIIWLYTYIYEEPSFTPADHNLCESENGVWTVAEGPDMPNWQPKMAFNVRDAHDNHVGQLVVESLEDLIRAHEGRRINLWFDERELNIVSAD